ncbi:MAG: hypothetical protein V1866_02065 [archaeon]
MTELVACVSTGKGTWLPVIKLINSEAWSRIFLISTAFAREKFQTDRKVEFIVIDPEKPLKTIVEDICKGLNKKLFGPEVALNLSSGTGKEHMAIISAVLRQGVGIRFVSFSGSSVEEI